MLGAEEVASGMLSFVILIFSVFGADEGNAREGFFEIELPLGVSTHWQLVELLLITFHLLNEVDEVARFLEELKVLCINHIAQFILNANHELNNIE